MESQNLCCRPWLASEYRAVGFWRSQSRGRRVGPKALKFCSHQILEECSRKSPRLCLQQRRSAELPASKTLAAPTGPDDGRIWSCNGKFPARRRRTRTLFPKAIFATEYSNSETYGNEGRNEEEFEKLLQLVPEHIRRNLEANNELDQLVEIVLDLGRRPLARFPSGDWFISHDPVSYADLDHAVALVGEFTDDNRAGVDRTLHRVSAIRNRIGGIVGLTCRMGRAIRGSAEMARDLVASGGSLLFMGPPGVGKTTAVREVARMLADEYTRRVVIVDTSNEIGGDGDIPHEGIGRARRMQVPQSEMQHQVMIEAVENHMPQAIIIDEIGTELEAFAAGTIAQRGVQLVGTAHGVTVENLIKKFLSKFVGRRYPDVLKSVTLGDEEARRRGVQKSVLERKGPPTFTAAIEMISRNEWRVHRSLAATVDNLLAGRAPKIEVRKMSLPDQDAVQSSTVAQEGTARTVVEESSRNFSLDSSDEDSDDEDIDDGDEEFYPKKGAEQILGTRDAPLVLYTHQVTEGSLKQVLEVMGLEESVQLTHDIGIADAVLALRTKLKSSDWVWSMAKFRQLPVFAIKANTMGQMVRAMRTIFQIDSLAPNTSLASPRTSEPRSSVFESAAGMPGTTMRKSTAEDEIDALEEARLAIEQFVIPRGQAVELLPRSPEIIALQVKFIEKYHFQMEKAGKYLNSRLRILPLPTSGIAASPIATAVDKQERSPQTSSSISNLSSLWPEENGGGTSVNRLPKLPE